jgi:hypothetical protein
LKGDNLQKILDNIQASAGATGPAGGSSATNKPAAASAKKIEVDDLLIKNGKVNLVLPVVGTVPVGLPDIHLTDLGKDSQGLTPAELASMILRSVLEGAMSAAKDVSKGVTGKQIEKVTRGIGDLFKK